MDQLLGEAFNQQGALREGCPRWTLRGRLRAEAGSPGGSDCVSLLQNKTPRRNNWRQKHEIFIQTLRQARQVQQVLSKGGKVSDLPPLPPIENPDYVACPYCRRRFAPQVAERHVPKCKSIKSRPPSPPQRKRC